MANTVRMSGVALAAASPAFTQTIPGSGDSSATGALGLKQALVQTVSGSGDSSATGALGVRYGLVQTVLGSGDSSAPSPQAIENYRPLVQTTKGTGDSSSIGSFNVTGALAQSVKGSGDSSTQGALGLRRPMTQTSLGSGDSSAFGAVTLVATPNVIRVSGFAMNAKDPVTLAQMVPGSAASSAFGRFSQNTIRMSSMQLRAGSNLTISTNGNQQKNAGDLVTIVATASGTTDAWTFTQTSGTPVSPTGSTGTRTFTAPYTLNTGNVITFEVRASQGATVSDPQTVSIGVYAHQNWYLAGSGAWLPIVDTSGSAPPAMTTPYPLVRVGTKLYANGLVTRLAGFQMYDAVITDNAGQVLSITPLGTVQAVFDAAKAMKMNAVRIHTIFTSYGKTGSAMPTTGVYDESVLVQADNVIAEAGKRGLWIMAPQCDRWDYYHGGGISFAKMVLGGAATLNDFYTNTTVRNAYKAYLLTLLNRVNTVTGVKWKDDPTLAILETGNEIWDVPKEWSDDMAAWNKANAPAKLVADGSAASGDTVNTKFQTSTLSINNANFDIVGSHFYDNHRMDVAQLQTQVGYAVSANKVFLSGEYDWRDTVQPTGGPAITTAATRAQWLTALESYGNGDFSWTFTGPATSGHNDGYQLLVTAPQNSEQTAGKAALAAHAAILNP